MFAAKWGEGLPGGLATGRRASFGLNSLSVLDSANLTTTVNQLLPEGAPYGQDNTLKQTLLFATIISQARISPFLSTHEIGIEPDPSSSKNPIPTSE